MTEGVKRTSVDLPISLWKRCKTRAAEENRVFRDILIEALEAYLSRKKGGKR